MPVKISFLVITALEKVHGGVGRLSKLGHGERGLWRRCARHLGWVVDTDAVWTRRHTDIHKSF